MSHEGHTLVEDDFEFRARTRYLITRPDTGLATSLPILALHGQGMTAPGFLHILRHLPASIAVAVAAEGRTSLHVAGKPVASNYPEDLRLERMLGHFPALFHPKPRSVLVVGMGTGVTAGSFVAYPEIERIVICEIEPLVLEAAAMYFVKENLDVLNDPRVEVVSDDARHYIASTQERFDIITSDPIHPWMEITIVVEIT